MARMLDMIRSSQVPSNLMQSAARGALSVPPEETIEILVYLALHHKLFGERARLTLAGWDEKASVAAAADPKTSAEVLGYYVSVENLRTCLLPALAENPSVTEEALDKLAATGSRSIVENLLASPRVMSAPRLLQALQTNANLRANELSAIATKLAAGEATPAAEAATSAADAPDEIVEFAVTKYLEENAAELAAEQDKPFQPIGMLDEGAGGAAAEAESQAAAAAAVETVEAAKVEAGRLATAAAGKTGAALAAAHAKKKLAPGQEERRDSTLQKISKLDIKGRIALAMRGNKEERSILIRDSTKLVSLAVLDSPKVSDAEVEKFALQKNVLESVLRAIPLKRKFAKNYSIMRNLVYNPRTPLDLSLGLMKNLLVHDLKNLSGNKEVSDTIRKLALRMFKQKLEKKG
jgi:hypothetical protein